MVMRGAGTGCLLLLLLLALSLTCCVTSGRQLSPHPSLLISICL